MLKIELKSKALRNIKIVLFSILPKSLNLYSMAVPSFFLVEFLISHEPSRPLKK